MSATEGPCFHFLDAGWIPIRSNCRRTKDDNAVLGMEECPCQIRDNANAAVVQIR